MKLCSLLLFAVCLVAEEPGKPPSPPTQQETNAFWQAMGVQSSADVLARELEDKARIAGEVAKAAREQATAKQAAVQSIVSKLKAAHGASADYDLAIEPEGKLAWRKVEKPDVKKTDEKKQ